jgi:hypothetical protein
MEAPKCVFNDASPDLIWLVHPISEDLCGVLLGLKALEFGCGEG